MKVSLIYVSVKWIVFSKSLIRYKLHVFLPITPIRQRLISSVDFIGLAKSFFLKFVISNIYIF